MNVLMISPGYPAEMAFFTRGLAAAGASVIGVGDQPAASVPAIARDALAHYIPVGSLAARDAVAAIVSELARQVRIDRVECLWEPYMMLAARLRQELDLPGLTVAQTVPFRDKERMKQLIDAAGLRTPGHEATETVAGVWAAAERLGFPLIVKPIAGAGSADTYRADSAAELDAILPMLRHVPRVSVEEFVDAEEFTYDTICADGRVLFENICWYLPRPLLTKLHERISPIQVALRDLDAPDLQDGRALGAAVLQVLGFRDGFTHMEWYRTADGEVFFGEIAARPPGARMVDVMNFPPTPTFSRPGRKRSPPGGSRSRSSGATTPRASSSAPRAPAGSRTTRASTTCWPSTASTWQRSSCSWSARRGATGGL